MSVYVGIDVHRRRSQVAVVTEGGKVQLSKNVVNGSGSMLRLIGDLPPGDAGGVRGRVRPGLAGRSAGGLRLRGAPGAPAAVPGDRLGAAEERQGAGAAVLARLLRADLLAEARGRPAGGAAAPRAAAAPGRAGPAAYPAAEPDPRGGSRFRLRPVRQLPVRARPRLAGRARTARRLPRDRDRRPGGHRPAGAPDRPDRQRAAPARQGRPAGQDLDHAARGRGSSPPWSCPPRPAASPGSAAPASWPAGPGSPRTARGPDRTVRPGRISGQGPARRRWVMNQAAQAARRSPGILRRLRRHRPAAREEDRHHRDLPQAADPRLAPARHRAGHRARRHQMPVRLPQHTPGREGRQPPG